MPISRLFRITNAFSRNQPRKSQLKPNPIQCGRRKTTTDVWPQWFQKHESDWMCEKKHACRLYRQNGLRCKSLRLGFQLTHYEGRRRLKLADARARKRVASLQSAQGDSALALNLTLISERIQTTVVEKLFSKLPYVHNNGSSKFPWSPLVLQPRLPNVFVECDFFKFYVFCTP